MANNIKIIGDINDIQRVNRLKLEDLNLLQSEIKNQTFGFENDYIEYFIYDISGNLINSNYNYRDFKLPFNSYLTPGSKLPEIEIDPIQDLKNLGYISGEFITQYNFQTRKISSPEAELFISQISEDRTEIRINSTVISSTELLNYGNKLIDELDKSIEQRYFLLNLINNTQFLVVNVAVDVDNPSILLKLYEPLTQQIQDKTSAWITEEIIEPYVFGLNLNTSVIPEEPPKLKGPNFDIDLDIKYNLGTQYENYSSLVSSLTGSSYQKVLNYMNDNSYDLNIDYTSFENFIHFSSAEKRLNIFYDKVKKIENYNNDINTIISSTNILKNEQTASIKLKINELTTNFDGFENYLYYESSSYAWPKSGSTKPYALLSTGSTTVQSWYNAYTGSAEEYDENNLDHLYNVIPNFVKNDPSNYQSYYDFIDMIGHYFDNIWIYVTSINELYNADNNLEKGVSKDLVYDALTSLGVKLYNAKSDDDFNDYIFGLNSGSTLFTDNFSVTSSYLNNIPKKDQLAELYKRIYHNIPLLSKTKGTTTGLQNLITTFGVTSSILNPKEFGGSTKKNEIKGYDNDKITIYNNTITGSVLSPFISLQQEPTASSEFTSTDLHFVDLSFSPQNQLNTRLSASIANLTPTFSLDQYIGDPGLMASSSYQSLIQQNNYFTSASSAISGSEKPLDYKGFIELVKYFDNSLFKMLKDFVPARTNALTGITIKSSILERNKVPVYQPKVDNQTVYDAGYNGPEFTGNIDSNYKFIEGNKSPYYTGELSGSYINVYNYFENSNPNPYTLPTSPININSFNHTDFNVMLNNVSSSVVSVPRQKLESLYTSVNGQLFLTGSNKLEITSSAELQDSYLTLQGHKNSRYNGSKISSLTYNTYTSASLIYSGDNSYGKTAVIDHNTRKLGLFTQITENVYLTSTKKNNVALKYLVDESGSLIELNKKNKHWNELQNTFKTADTLTVSLFDNQKYSDQKATDGIKPIFDSGYNYVPVLYFSGSEDKAYFEYTGDNIGKIFQSKNIVGVSPGPTGYISGSYGGNDSYPLIASGTLGAQVIYNIFDVIESNDGNLFTIGSTSSNMYPSYSVPSNGSYTFSSEFDITLDLKATNQSASFNYEIIKGGIDGNGHPTGSILGSTGIKTLASSYSTVLFGRGYNFISNPGFTYSEVPYPLSNSYSPLIIFDGVQNKVLTLTWSGNTNVFTGDDLNTYYLVSGTWTFDDFDPGGYTPTFNKLIVTANNDGNMNANDYILTSVTSADFSSTQIGTLSFNLTTSEADLLAGDKVYFKLTQITSSTSNYTASFSSAGKLRNNLTSNASGNYVYAEGTSVNHLISCSVSSNNDGNYDAIVLNTSLSGFVNYQFVAEQGIGNNRILYNTYGAVNETFSPSAGDVVVMYWDGQITEMTIKNLDYDELGKRSIIFTSNLPSSLKTKLNDPGNTLKGGVNTFLLLKKKPDETNLLLKFNKKPGNTAVGLVIPQNIHPDVLANIDNITKEVKQKLIDIGFADGGTF
jgi:hypothetical protein